MAPPDAILGVTEAFKRDPNPSKINLGVGAYRTDEGKPHVLDCVRRAERLLAQENLDKEYTGITGVPAFTEASVRLLLGERSEVVAKGLYGCAQTLSGTGGLRVGAEFLKKYHAYEKVPGLSYFNCVLISVFLYLASSFLLPDQYKIGLVVK